MSFSSFAGTLMISGGEAGVWMGTAGAQAAPTSTLRARHVAGYGITLNARHRLGYADARRLLARCAAGYAVVRAISARVGAGYALLDYNPIAGRLVSAYALASARVRSIAHEPRLLIGTPTRMGRMISCDLSTDEGSARWIARIALADAADYAALALGDDVQLALGVEQFSLRVDGKEGARSGPEGLAYSLTAVSPLAWMDAPHAEVSDHVFSQAQLASEIVEALLGPVSWSMVDWVVPAGVALFPSSTPLAAARAVVEAAGGRVESLPDGGIVCRPEYPVSVPQYALAEPAALFLEGELFEAHERIQPESGFNRVVVSGQGSVATAQDSLSYEASKTQGRAGVIRALLGVERPVQLVHTASDVTISALGRVQRRVSEWVEFVAGEANLSFSADSAPDVRWQVGAGLGALVGAVTGKHLVAEQAGYALAEVSYLTSAHEWSVQSEIDGDVQFVLMDDEAAGAVDTARIEVYRGDGARRGADIDAPLLGADAAALLERGRTEMDRHAQPRVSVDLDVLPVSGLRLGQIVQADVFPAGSPLVSRIAGKVTGIAISVSDGKISQKLSVERAV